MYTMFSHVTIKLIGLLVLGVFGAGGAVVFVWNDIYAVHAENADFLHEKAYAQIQVDQLSQVRALAGGIAEDREALDGYLTRESEVIHLLEEMERLGEVVGSVVTIENVDATTVPLAENALDVPVVRITVTIEGVWEAVIQTIELLELLPKYSVVQNVSVATQPSSGWRAELTLVLPRNQ